MKARAGNGFAMARAQDAAVIPKFRAKSHENRNTTLSEFLVRDSANHTRSAT